MKWSRAVVTSWLLRWLHERSQFLFERKVAIIPSMHSREKNFSFTVTYHPGSSQKQMWWKGLNSLFALIFCTSQSWETFQPFEHFCLRSGSSYKMQNGDPFHCLTAGIPVQTRQGISHSLHLYFEPDYQKERVSDKLYFSILGCITFEYLRREYGLLNSAKPTDFHEKWTKVSKI